MGDAANIIVGAATISVNAADVGYTKGGCEVRYEPAFLEVMADQAVGVVRKARTSERMYVKTMVLEATLIRIRQAFMLPSASLVGSTLTLGYNNACWVDEVALVLVGEGPNCGTRTFTFARCITFGNRVYSMKRDEETAFELEFEILKNSSGVFGTIIDS